MAKILVTGGAGFIASHVVDLYIQSGHDVVIVDDLSTGRERNINPSAKFFKVDIRDPQLNVIFEKEQPEYINHHAAQMDVRRSVVNFKLDADINIFGSINLLECAKTYGVKRFVYISTGGAVYGELEYLLVMNPILSSRSASMEPVNIQSSTIYICTTLIMVLNTPCFATRMYTDQDKIPSVRQV
jgi:nucleoside-diphosphate-sugar epimerase